MPDDSSGSITEGLKLLAPWRPAMPGGPPEKFLFVPGGRYICCQAAGAKTLIGV